MRTAAGAALLGLVSVLLLSASASGQPQECSEDVEVLYLADGPSPTFGVEVTALALPGTQKVSIQLKKVGSGERVDEEKTNVTGRLRATGEPSRAFHGTGWKDPRNGSNQEIALGNGTVRAPTPCLQLTVKGNQTRRVDHDDNESTPPRSRTRTVTMANWTVRRAQVGYFLAASSCKRPLEPIPLTPGREAKVCRSIDGTAEDVGTIRVRGSSDGNLPAASRLKAQKTVPGAPFDPAAINKHFGLSKDYIPQGEPDYEPVLPVFRVDVGPALRDDVLDDLQNGTSPTSTKAPVQGGVSLVSLGDLLRDLKTLHGNLTDLKAMTAKSENGDVVAAGRAAADALQAVEAQMDETLAETDGDLQKRIVELYSKRIKDQVHTLTSDGLSTTRMYGGIILAGTTTATAGATWGVLRRSAAREHARTPFTAKGKGRSRRMTLTVLGVGLVLVAGIVAFEFLIHPVSQFLVGVWPP